MRILFLAGPSGAGKSHFASQYLAKNGWFHLEIDRHEKGNGIDLENLRAESDAFWIHHDSAALRQELLRRAADASYMVLSFASSVVFDAEHLRAAAGWFCIAYLYGRPQFCLRSFLEREQSMGRELAIRHWDEYNRETFGKLSLSWNQPLLIEAFSEDGSRRDSKEIYDDIMSRMRS